MSVWATNCRCFIKPSETLPTASLRPDGKELSMDVMEAVKDKARYKEIVTYFQGTDNSDTEQLALLIDTIEQMSEEIFEHYRAMQEVFKKAVARILMRRDREGGFDFLTDPQKGQLSYALKKAGALRVILWEKYEEYDRELNEGRR